MTFSATEKKKKDDCDFLSHNLDEKEVPILGSYRNFTILKKNLNCKM